jgi:hypothetical protein
MDLILLALSLVVFVPLILTPVWIRRYSRRVRKPIP